MVKGSEVRSNLSDFSKIISDYSSYVSGLTSSWKGTSYDSLVSKSEEFVSEYENAITNQLNSFAEACDLYEEYHNKKQQLDSDISSYNIAVSNYNNAVSNKNTANIDYYSGQINQLDSEIETLRVELESLKASIESSLSAASTPSLSAVSSNPSITVPEVSNNDSSVEQANSNNSSSYIVNDTMRSIANVAANNSGGGYDGMCEMWAEIQCQNATGITRNNQVSAYGAWQNYGVSTSRDNIPVGAMVYGSGLGDGNYNPYGHVGIYVGDGMVADQGGVQTMDEWLNWQVANCDGHVGYIGWGWYNGIDLTQLS